MKTYAACKHDNNYEYFIRLPSRGGQVIFLLLPAIFLFALFVSCAIGRSNYQNSRDVSRQFENGEVAAGHRYYVSGPESKPIAIVAIREDYRLEADHWREIDVDSASLKALVERIAFVLESEDKEALMIPNGARIIGPDGDRVGMWYSIYDYSKATFMDDKVIHLAAAVTRMPFETRIFHFY